MTTKKLIEQLRNSQFVYPDIGKYPSDRVLDEIIQRLTEHEGLKEYKRKMVEFDKKARVIIPEQRRGNNTPKELIEWLKSLGKQFVEYEAQGKTIEEQILNEIIKRLKELGKLKRACKQIVNAWNDLHSK